MKKYINEHISFKGLDLEVELISVNGEYYDFNLKRFSPENEQFYNREDVKEHLAQKYKKATHLENLGQMLISADPIDSMSEMLIELWEDDVEDLFADAVELWWLECEHDSREGDILDAINWRYGG